MMFWNRNKKEKAAAGNEKIASITCFRWPKNYPLRRYLISFAPSCGQYRVISCWR